MHHEEALFLHDREFSYVAEDIAEETFTKNVSSPSESSHNKTASILTILCPFAAVRCSLQSLSADRLMPASVTRSPSVNFKNLLALSISSHSVSSASLKEIWFRKSTVCYRIGSWSLESSHWKKYIPPASKKMRSAYDVICVVGNDFHFGRKEEENSGNNFIYYFLEKYHLLQRIVCWNFYQICR